MVCGVEGSLSELVPSNQRAQFRGPLSSPLLGHVADSDQFVSFLGYVSSELETELQPTVLQTNGAFLEPKCGVYVPRICTLSHVLDNSLFNVLAARDRHLTYGFEMMPCLLLVGDSLLQLNLAGRMRGGVAIDDFSLPSRMMERGRRL